MKKPIGSSHSLVLTTLMLSMLACRPIITIGWQEIGILVVLLLILLGPLLFRLYKRFDEFQRWKANKGEPRSDD